MNKEEMEKKRAVAFNKHWVVRNERDAEWIEEIFNDAFKEGWDACAKEYEKALLIAKADIMNLTEEIERLKS